MYFAKSFFILYYTLNKLVAMLYTFVYLVELLLTINDISFYKWAFYFQNESMWTQSFSFGFWTSKKTFSAF